MKWRGRDKTRIWKHLYKRSIQNKDKSSNQGGIGFGLSKQVSIRIVLETTILIPGRVSKSFTWCPLVQLNRIE